MEASPIDPSMRSALLPWGSSKGTMSTSTDRAASSGIGSGGAVDRLAADHE